MQVYPESSVPVALGRGGVDDHPYESHNLPPLRAPPPPPPPMYPPPAYQPPSHPPHQLPPLGRGQSADVGPPPYSAQSSYLSAPQAFGYAPTTAPQLQNNQNVQLNIFGAATAARPTVISQPAPIVVSPPSYLGWSIFNCLCCFWPLGLAAIVYSVKVGNARNHEEAKDHSVRARNLNIAATTIAPLLAIVVVGAVLGSAATASLYSPSSYYSSSYYNGYYYYYTYLMYYTTNQSFTSIINVYYYNYYYWSSGFLQYTLTQYRTATASKYAVGLSYWYY